MKSQKLGRGLGALLSEIEEAYENEVYQKDSIIEIPLKDIRPNPFQPRKYFDENSLQELGESIKNDGLLQPIVVTEDVDGYILIAGERRLRASKIAKLKTIRAIILNSDEQRMRQFALIENIQRDELNSIELAHAYGELIKLHNITQDELSSKIHKSRTHITNTIRLLQLSQKTQKALIEKKITTGHAKVLVGLDEKQQQLIVDSVVGQKLSVREVEATIKSIKNGKTEPSHEVKISFDFKNAKEKLSALGFKIKNSGKSLTIEFDNENHISDFLNYFSK
ncbi:MAG: ParB/RepB/Spo0J family partition protein [Sulfurimonas sp.]|jgi:ParB family chromosome partitioning protein|uniref:ParB/RepB/Spo0J family partition protein n=1 Tax=unclassified Sulfurimonas TaxID=2623549 RepID=UPI0008AFE89F|nr:MULTISPECIES: ParB/RepB/Spo0J family partition protein [unclassified Sulfurimonas]OHE08096.1 MAG: chromosome partitioning protein ParB [Sulfurimonas sp. RIFOXYC2_FULL_36_7]MBS4069440.1 ParB/RepB/Spo0J family partition protein [Sulfurimonas sp.]MDD3856221.1 ParB/RepB/Spo0J family partition protein [Sulfurimonas sp.]MDX9756268.1 ParB/RepB/Spo0J family partition protein [Sulfurimonas sp.]OHE04155.1 MAG: chromosome partitioning protein ParB [Sulfurimonas sp. RIFOXYB12_FULL_35_9]